MYKFIIEYYFSRYHTGELNYGVTRTAVVFANNTTEAIEKTEQADERFISIANLSFEEMVGEGE